MFNVEEFVHDTEIKIQELKEVLELVKQYPTKELIQMAIEGRIDGHKSFIKGIKNEERNIL